MTESAVKVYQCPSCGAMSLLPFKAGKCSQCVVNDEWHPETLTKAQEVAMNKRKHRKKRVFDRRRGGV